MGSFYANVTLRGTDVDAVREACPRPAHVAADGDQVVVFAEVDARGELVSGAGLSQELDCLAVSVGVHDDDVLFWQVHRDGTAVATGAVPDPSVAFDVGEPGPPVDALANGLAAAVDRPDLAAPLTALLARDHEFASDLHAGVVGLLGLAPSAVGWGYGHLGGDAVGAPATEHLT